MIVEASESALRPRGAGRLGKRAISHAIDEEELRPLLRPEIEERLIGLAHQNYQGPGWPKSSRPSSPLPARRLEPREERLTPRPRGTG